MTSLVTASVRIGRACVFRQEVHLDIDCNCSDTPSNLPSSESNWQENFAIGFFQIQLFVALNLTLFHVLV